MLRVLFFTTAVFHLATAADASGNSPHPIVELNASGGSVKSAGGAAFTCFCYPGVAVSPLAHWRQVRLELEIDAARLQAVYTASNASEVAAEHAAATARYLSLVPPRRDRLIRLAPFERTCVGVSTTAASAGAADEKYVVRVSIRYVDFWLVLVFGCGVLVFLNAERLSGNVAFHYGSGVTLGVLGAVLIAVYMVSRLVPRRGGACALLLTGWSLGLYVLQYAADNARLYLHAYRHYVLGYLLVSAGVSLAVCYRYGPVRDARTRQLLRWLLQLLGLAAVVWAGNVPQISGGAVALLLVWRLLPSGAMRRCAAAVRRRMVRPQPRRMLTADEYEQQAVTATRQALDELRQFCRSPQCDAWRTVSRLDSPLRFVSFMEGESHLSDHEMSEYELQYSRLDEPATDQCDKACNGAACREFMTSDEDSD